MSIAKPDGETRESVRTKGRPSLAEADEINRTIREAALQVLLAHGEGATINAVAKAAGLTRKSLYARYPGKNDLFVDVIRQALEHVGPMEIPSEGDFKQKLRSYVNTALTVIAKPESRAVQRLIALDPVYVAALRDDLMAAGHTLFFRPLLAILTQAHDSGEITVDNPQAAAEVLIRLIFAEGAMPEAAAVNSQGTASKTERAELITRIVLYGLLPRE